MPPARHVVYGAYPYNIDSNCLYSNLGLGPFFSVLIFALFWWHGLYQHAETFYDSFQGHPIAPSIIRITFGTKYNTLREL
jgi:hypothetical protein